MTDKNQKIKYLLGIDGGGTKTEFLLTDLNGTEIKRIFLGASNPVNIGIDNTKNILSEGISKSCAGINTAAISVFTGIAGAGSENIKNSIGEFLSEFGFGAFANGCDTDNAIRAALNGGNGVAVIMGTGIIAYACLDGKMHRTGGRGYLIDKGGSGFCFGSDALNSAFEAIDGRGGSKLMLKLIENKLGKTIENSVADIYAGGAAYVGSFAPVVFEAYKIGDCEAEAIIDRNCREAAKIIRAALDFLGGESQKVVICGGLCRCGDILKPFLIKYLGGIIPEFLSTETVSGAISIAKSLTEEI